MTSDQEIAYWMPRVMRHQIHPNGEEYGIHEVYFGKDNEVVAYTEDALSPRASSVSSLKTTLLGLLVQGQPTITSGDLGYDYTTDDVQAWLGSLEDQPIDYK